MFVMCVGGVSAFSNGDLTRPLNGVPNETMGVMQPCQPESSIPLGATVGTTLNDQLAWELNDQLDPDSPVSNGNDQLDPASLALDSPLAWEVSDLVDPEPMAIDPESLVQLASFVSVESSTPSNISTSLSTLKSSDSSESLESIRDNVLNNADAEGSIIEPLHSLQIEQPESTNQQEVQTESLSCGGKCATLALCCFCTEAGLYFLAFCVGCVLSIVYS
ncbi:MAG: hypothetical protein LBQ43_04195 [Holosporales bacterium]|nr:hypothetical protein [Holosporales bacterium]